VPATAAASTAGAATPFRPIDPGFVLRVAQGSSRARAGFARQLELSRSDPQLAAQLAGTLLEQARLSAQPQLYGRAESLVAPWLARPTVPRCLQDILQHQRATVGRASQGATRLSARP